ncbi:MAG: ElyC/SanA/YdcF family protein [Puniceicoccaceae bacterium]
MIFFHLRKIVSGLLYPPVFCLLLAIAGVLLARSRRWGRAGRMILAAGLAGLFLLSLPVLQRPFLRWMEIDAVPPAGGEIAAIVVLGGGVRTAGGDAPATHGLPATSLARAVEGIRLAGLHPGVPLVFTGGRIGERPASSGAMAGLAREFGIDPGRIVAFSTPTSTAEEARRTAEALGGGRILLVTSALHLPRALLLFEAQGFEPLPAPTDFLADDRPLQIRDFLPSAGTWWNWQRYFHEGYGRLWAAARGQGRVPSTRRGPTGPTGKEERRRRSGGGCARAAPGKADPAAPTR